MVPTASQLKRWKEELLADFKGLDAALVDFMLHVYRQQQQMKSSNDILKSNAPSSPANNSSGPSPVAE